VVPDLDTALAVAGEVPEVTVIGGAQVYALALPLAGRILLTEVHARPEGDAHLASFDPQVWQEIARERWPADERHACDMSFVTLIRRAAA
jgi:dihydrofolate reductase